MPAMTITDPAEYARAAARVDPLRHMSSYQGGNAYDPDHPSDEDEHDLPSEEYDPARPLIDAPHSPPPHQPRHPLPVLIMSTSPHNCIRPENIELFLNRGVLNRSALEFRGRSAERVIHVHGAPLRVIWSMTAALDEISRGELDASDIRGFVIEAVRHSELRRSEVKLMRMLGPMSPTISMISAVARAPSWMKGAVHLLECGTPAGVEYALTKLRQLLRV